MKSIIEIIESIDGPNIPNINPTVIYNEGWMTRLLVNQSIKEKTKLSKLDFGEISNWTSEALISSPFILSDHHREGYTHPDIALGDFKIDYEISGKLTISSNAKIFGIIEAKMGSNFSKRVSNAENYNQASRTLACIASQTYIKDCKTFFMVVAPKSKLQREKGIKSRFIKSNMIDEIKKRFDFYTDSFRTEKEMDSILANAEKCDVWSISYEEWIDSIVNTDSKKYLNEFYAKTIAWNQKRKKNINENSCWSTMKQN